jgi:hypothetical protein
MYQHVGILSQSIKSTVMEFLSLDIWGMFIYDEIVINNKWWSSRLGGWGGGCVWD